MTPSDSPPKLPLWIFFATDAALLGAAILIARESARPLSSTATLGIVGCLVAGTLVVLIPLIARYERAKNETLDERQRALEGLARTVTSSAEQIGIVVGGLHEITELAQKNLRQAEQLPHKLQEKIAEFKAQLADATDTEKEELEKELVALRTSESERLETTSTRIAKTAAELAKLEAATQQHLAAAHEAIAKLSLGTAAAIGKAQAAAEQALSQARVEAARHLGETGGTAARAVETAKAAALAEIDAKLIAAGNAFVERLARELAARPTPPPVPVAIVDAPVPTPSDPAPISPAASDASNFTPADVPSVEAAPVPKRPRKPRREEPEVPSSPATAAGEPVVSEPATPAEPTPVDSSPATSEPVAPPSADSASLTAGQVPVVPAPAPEPAVPEALPAAASPDVSPSPSALESGGNPPADAETGKAPKKRSPKKPEAPAPADEPALDLGIQDSPAAASSERVLSSDGATRVLVTAYIGIGNRLFIRGTGPGLSWDKGVPLQFVSIGKWRWETSDAAAPVQFKLYKNDTVECTALGEQSLDPGYQQEVTAGF